MRIVSLLPSATEIVCALGLEESLVGVTHECDYPIFVKGLPKVTQTLIPEDASSRQIDDLVRERLRTNKALYTLNMQILEALRPDLLVTQALCDVCAVAEEEVNAANCSLPGRPRVINLEPVTLDDALECLTLVGGATGRENAASTIVKNLRRRICAIAARSDVIPKERRPRVAFLEWIDPLFNAGHWNPMLIELAGGIDVLGNAGQPSRTTSWRNLVDSRPDVLFIACCGYSAERTLQDTSILEQHPGWEDLPCVRSGRVYVTDGNAYFSRPGPRLIDGLEIMARALHPEIHGFPDNLPAALQVFCRSN